MPNVPNPNLQNRHKKLAYQIQTSDLDAFVFNPGPSLKYLTGLQFHLSERPVVLIFIPDQPFHLVLPELEAAKLENTPYPIAAYPYGENPAGWLNSSGFL